VLFQVLGPFLAMDDEGVLFEVVRGKHRYLLALLLFNANLAVSSEYLIEHLWQGRAPRSALNNLRSYITQLRRLLAPTVSANSPIRTSANGYLLSINPEDVDAYLFEDLVAQGRRAVERSDLAAAADAYERALALWRGEALHGLEMGDELRAWQQRLHEERLAITEDLFDVRLSLGRHAELIGQLTDFTYRNPFRERAYAQLMLALHRCGRQSEALAVYRRLRDSLMTHIACEPTPLIRDLHHRILRADPSLTLQLAFCGS
jgi:DNA-binding SARP family transcriptional activator